MPPDLSTAVHPPNPAEVVLPVLVAEEEEEEEASAAESCQVGLGPEKPNGHDIVFQYDDFVVID
jgi:hypothetical protein